MKMLIEFIINTIIIIARALILLISIVGVKLFNIIKELKKQKDL